MPTSTSRRSGDTPPSPTSTAPSSTKAKSTSKASEGVTGDLDEKGKKYIGSMSSTSFTIMIILIIIGILAICFLIWWVTVGKARRQKKKDLQQFTIQNSDGSSSTTVIKPNSNSVV